MKTMIAMPYRRRGFLPASADVGLHPVLVRPDMACAQSRRLSLS